MYLIGDIGNTEIKVCLVDHNYKIIKKVYFSNHHLSLSKLKMNFSKFRKFLPRLEKILFCSVVPRSFKLIKRYLKIKSKVRCYEVKQLKLSSLIKIKVDFKQVGSDRLTNAISLKNNHKNSS